MPRFTVAGRTARAGRVANAELIWVQKQRIAIGDVQLFLVSQKPSSALRDTLYQPVAQRLGEKLVFFVCELYFVLIGATEFIQAILVLVLLRCQSDCWCGKRSSAFTYVNLSQAFVTLLHGHVDFIDVFCVVSPTECGKARLSVRSPWSGTVKLFPCLRDKVRNLFAVVF